jgi:hypothetical protein
MTDYRPLRPIRFADLFDGTLEPFGVRGHHNDECTNQRRCLTDGNNYLWACADDAGFVISLTRYALNGAPGKILSAIAEAFDVDIVSEYEPQYFGFETQEEWDAAEAKQAEEDDARFYEEVMKYVRGEAHDLEPGTNGIAWAQQAKLLIAQDPSWGLPDRKAELLEAARRPDPRFVVKLSEADMATIRMRATHEDDLPKV